MDELEIIENKLIKKTSFNRIKKEHNLSDDQLLAIIEEMIGAEKINLEAHKSHG